MTNSTMNVISLFNALVGGTNMTNSTMNVISLFKDLVGGTNINNSTMNVVSNESPLTELLEYLIHNHNGKPLSALEWQRYVCFSIIKIDYL